MRNGLNRRGGSSAGGGAPAPTLTPFVPNDPTLWWVGGDLGGGQPGLGVSPNVPCDLETVYQLANGTVVTSDALIGKMVSIGVNSSGHARLVQAMNIPPLSFYVQINNYNNGDVGLEPVGPGGISGLPIDTIDFTGMQWVFSALQYANTFGHLGLNNANVKNVVVGQAGNIYGVEGSPTSLQTFSINGTCGSAWPDFSGSTNLVSLSWTYSGIYDATLPATNTLKNVDFRYTYGDWSGNFNSGHILEQLAVAGVTDCYIDVRSYCGNQPPAWGDRDMSGALNGTLGRATFPSDPDYPHWAGQISDQNFGTCRIYQANDGSWRISHVNDSSDGDSDVWWMQTGPNSTAYPDGVEYQPQGAAAGTVTVKFSVGGQKGLVSLFLLTADGTGNTVLTDNLGNW